MAIEDPNAVFPRFGLHDLLGAEERARDRRFGATAWLGGLVAALLFLAFPTVRLFDAGPAMVAAVADGRTGEAFGRFGVSAPAAAALAPLTGGSVERAAFLVSALCAGLALPVVAGLARRVGAGWPAAYAAAGFALLAPGSLAAATTPGPASAALLGGAVLASGLVPLPRESDAGRTFAHVAAALLLAPALAPLTACAVLAHLEPARGRRQALHLAVPLAIGGAGLALLLRETWIARPLAPFAAAPLDWSWLATPTAAGLGLLTLPALARRPARAEESPPPVWILVWAALAVPLGVPALELAVPLAPVAAVGLLYAVDRLRDTRRGPALAAAVALQAVLGAGALAAVRAGDPDAAWRAAARARLEPTDRLVTAHPRHALEARERFGLAVDRVAPDELGARAAAASPGTVVDPVLVDGSAVSVDVVPEWVRLDTTPPR